MSDATSAVPAAAAPAAPSAPAASSTSPAGAPSGASKPARSDTGTRGAFGASARGKPAGGGRAPLRPGAKAPGARPAPRADAQARASVAEAGRPPTARAVALQALARVAATDAYLNVVLDSLLDELPLKDPRDAALVTELAYGTTRRQLTLDSVLAPLCDRKLESIEDLVLSALRMGAYQHFYTRVPPHAAVGDTIEALKSQGLERAAGFVNAILRKVTAMASPPLPPESDRVAHLSIKHSHPQWLVARWLRQFGPERAEQMLASDNLAPPLVVRANTAKVTRDDLLTQLTEMGVEARATPLSPLGIVFESPGRIEDIYGYREGLWQVQDEAAQLVSVFAQLPEGARVLDTCAAPGGKTCHAAQTHEVVSLDVHANKLHKIDEEARRLGLRDRVTLEALDASKPLPERLGEFDVVMVDAPCTGLGTLRRHPELRYRRAEKDFAALASLQREILESAQAAVKAGGLLIYAVCSTDSTEGPDQVELFLRSHPEFTAEPPVGLPDLPTFQGHLRTLPGPEGLDGFFAARLRKMY